MDMKIDNILLDFDDSCTELKIKIADFDRAAIPFDEVKTKYG